MPTCCAETSRPPNRSKAPIGITRGDRRRTSTVFHLLDTTVRPFSSFSSRTVGLCERFRFHSQEQIQSLRQHEPQTASKGASPGDGRRCNERFLASPPVLPLPWPSPRCIDHKAQSLFIDPHTSLPQLRAALAPHICLPNKPLFIPFHSHFPNEILRCLIRTLSLT